MSKEKLQFLSPLFLKYQAEFEKNPRSRVFAPLAESYRKVGMLDKAIEILSQGIRFNPSYVMGYLGLAACYFDMKQFNLAYSTLRPLVDNNRDNLRLQKLFAESCLELLRKEEALDTLKYLLFINPRDKEVAFQVTSLEQELEEKYRHVHKPIVIPAEELTDNANKVELFDVSKLEVSPKIEFDDWLHVDFNQKESTNSEVAIKNNLDDWSVVKKVDKAEEVYQEEVVNLVPSQSQPQLEFLDLSELEDEEPTVPIVTHTLVDLYCGQGHIEKALEVLEKILELNPTDKKTIDKIIELKALMGTNEPEMSLASEQEEYQEQKVETRNIHLIEKEDTKKDNLLTLNELDNVSEEDGRRALMNILDEKVLSNLTQKLNKADQVQKRVEEKNVKIQEVEERFSKFLQKIRERALDIQNRV